MDRIDSRRLCKLEHPGLVFATFIEPYGISQNSLARGMGVSPRRLDIARKEVPHRDMLDRMRRTPFTRSSRPVTTSSAGQ
jgi:plasmid maintenance system antidote protein VapI